MPERTPTAPRLPRAVILLSWVSFLADISSEMVYPILPLFVVGVLGATTTSLGWIEGLGAACVALLTAASGWHSDARGGRGTHRVLWVRIGYGLPVLGRAMIALAPAWGWVLAGRVVDRVGKGVRGSPRDALIADVTPPDLRGRAFGFHRLMDTLGALLGVLLAAGLLYALIGSVRPGGGDGGGRSGITPGSLASHATAIRWIVAVGAVLALASMALTFLVREPKADPPRLANPASPSPDRAFSGAYWRVVPILGVFSIANSSDAFILLRLADAGLSPWAVVLAYALFNLIYALASYPAGILSDRLGRRRLILAGWLLYAGVYAALAALVPGSAAWMIAVWGIMAIYGLYTAFTDGVGKALAADVAPPGRRGAAMGVLAMTTGLGTLAGSLLAGALWRYAGAPWAFGTGAALALLAAVLGLLLLPPGRRT